MESNFFGKYLLHGVEVALFSTIHSPNYGCFVIRDMRCKIWQKKNFFFLREWIVCFISYSWAGPLYRHKLLFIPINATVERKSIRGLFFGHQSNNKSWPVLAYSCTTRLVTDLNPRNSCSIPDHGMAWVFKCCLENELMCTATNFPVYPATKSCRLKG